LRPRLTYALISNYRVVAVAAVLVDDETLSRPTKRICIVA
jgi:hypothetical protein